MVGVIVVGPVRQDQVGPEVADQADELVPRFERRHQLAVGVIEHVVGRRR